MKSAQQGKSVSRTSPMHIIFIADDSGSMRGEPAAQINQAIEMWINELVYFSDKGQKNYFYFSLLTFGTRARAYTDEPTPLIEVNPSLAPINGTSGGTQFAPALRMARELLEKHPPKATDCPPLVYLYTDGKADDPEEAMREAELLKRMDLTCGPLCLVVLGCYQAEEQFLSRLASHSEYYFHCKDRETLTSILPDLGSRMVMNTNSVASAVDEFRSAGGWIR